MNFGRDGPTAYYPFFAEKYVAKKQKVAEGDYSKIELFLML